MVVNGLRSSFNSWCIEKPFMVVRIVDGRAWVYDAWDDANKAIKQAIEVGGMVIPTSEVEMGE